MNGFDLSQLSPDELDSMMELGGLDEQQQLLAEQLQQALALQQPSGHQYRTAAGTVLGGIGDMINSGMGANQEAKLRAQQQQLLAQKGAGRKTFATLLREAGKSLPSAPLLEAPPQDDSFGYGGDAPTPFGYSPGVVPFRR